MKKILSFLIIMLAAVISYGQTAAPGIFNYQGVARNSVGNALVNKTINLRLTIHDGAAAGPVVYQESRLATTNPFGLFNVQVGSPGTLTQVGLVSNVNWGVNTKFIQVEIDPNGGTSFINVGTAQIASVPYSLYSSLANDLVLPFNKTQADAGTLFRIVNSGTGSGSTALEGQTNSTAGNAYAIIGRVNNASPGSFSTGVRGINNGTGGLGIGVWGSQDGSGWGVYGTAVSGWGVYGAATSGTGGRFTTTSGLALHTTGGLRLQGILEGAPIAPNLFKLLAGDPLGNATWQHASAIGLVSGSGTLNYVPKWTPNGTTLGNSQIFDDGTNVGVGTVAPFSKLTVVQNNSGVNLGGGATTGSEIKFLNFGTSHMSIYNSGNNALTFAQTSALSQTNVAGTPLMTLTSGGNLGIGTVTPATRLHVAGQVRIVDGTQGINRLFFDNGAGLGTGEWRTLAGAGIIGGSGTLNRVAKFTPDGFNIGNSLSWDDGSRVRTGLGPTFADNNTLTITTTAATGNDASLSLQGNAGGGPTSGIYLEAATNRTHLTANNFNTASGTKVMTWDGANLNVGIGIAAPTARLHVTNPNNTNAGNFMNTSGANTVGALRGFNAAANVGSWGVHAVSVSGTGFPGEATHAALVAAATTGVGTVTSSPNNYGLHAGSITNHAIFAQNFGGGGNAGLFGVSLSGSGFGVAGNVPAGTGAGGYFTGGTTALRTLGGVQLTGINEAVNRILATIPGTGQATWEDPSTVGIVSGSGTLNFLAKWTPNGTTLGNSMFFDDASTTNIAGGAGGNRPSTLTLWQSPGTTQASLMFRSPLGELNGIHNEDDGKLYLTANTSNPSTADKIMTLDDATLNVGIGTVSPAAKLHALSAPATGGPDAVLGESNNTDASAVGVRGVITSAAPGGFSAGVRGINNGTGGNGIGVYGSQNGSGWGVYGTTPSGIGVFGSTGTGTGVSGSSGSGTGVFGISATGFAGNFMNTNAANAVATVRAFNSSANINAVGVHAISVGGSGYGPLFASAMIAESFAQRGILGVSNANVAVHGASNTSVGVLGESYASTGNAGVLGLGLAVNNFGVVGNAAAGTGAGGYFTGGTTALRTLGGVQLTGIGEAPNRILATIPGTGQATWENPAGLLAPLFWSTTGNAGTVDGTNFIGTTDNVPFNFRVNNQRAGKIDQLTANTSLGYTTLNNNTTGTFNSAFGYFALNSNTTGSANTAVGAVSLQNNTTANYNTAVGYNVLRTNTTGSQNVAIGGQTLSLNTTGSFNMAFGPAAMNVNTTGSSNIAMGNFTLSSNTTGGINTALGTQSLQFNTTGGNNVAVGAAALNGNTIGSNNTAIGTFANVTVNNLNNATAIGFNAQVSASNSLVLGNNANVGIGVSNPGTKLHVVANAPGSQVELLRNLDVTGFSGTWYQSSGGSVAGHVGYGNPGAFAWANQMFAGSIAAIPFVLTTSDIERMRITPAGDVGIGTSTPFVKFHVNSGTSFNTSLLEAQDANNAGPHQYFYSGGEFAIVDYIRTDYTGALSAQRLGALEVRGVNRLNLSPTNSVDMSGGMTIITNGNVGIGQPAPVAKLDVLNTGIGLGTIKAYQPNEINVPTIKSFGGGVIVNDISIIGGIPFRNSAVFAQSGNFAVGTLQKVNGNPDAIYATGLGSNDGIEVSVQDGFGVASTIRGTGTALFGWDPVGTGTALRTIGNVRMGNIGEANGYVLTSDAVGNATWQGPVSFRVRNFSIPVSLPLFTYVTLNQWAAIDYENGSLGNYNPVTGEYTVPQPGTYHVDAQIGLLVPGATGAGYSGIDVFINGVQQVYGLNGLYAMGSGTGIRVSSDIVLNAGDLVTIRVFHNTSGSVAASLIANHNYWSIHKVK